MEQDHIGDDVTAGNREGFAVGRELKNKNGIGGEVGQHMAFGAVKRLRPDIADAVFDDRVDQGFAIGRKGNELPGVRTHIENFCGASRFAATSIRAILCVTA